MNRNLISGEAPGNFYLCCEYAKQEYEEESMEVIHENSLWDFELGP